MKSYHLACIVLSSALLATTPSGAKATKYTSSEIGASKTCKQKDAAMPVEDCMKKFGDTFCKAKGHKTHIMVNWSSSGDGYANPDLIYCK